MSKTTGKSSERNPGFEASLERLETLVREMEGGQLSLEKMMAHFEEGMRLVRVCSTRLNEVEQKIEQLVQKGGVIVTEPFEPAILEGDSAASKSREDDAHRADDEEPV